MVWSKYNYLFQAEDKYLIYNSLTNSFAELNEETFQLLSKMKENNNIENILDLDLAKTLQSMKVLVDDDRDEINKIKYRVQKRRFYDKHMGLTINPTLQCNFACPYCFESKHSNLYMTDEVENQIIEYIRKHSSVKSLHVTWFGGGNLCLLLTEL